MQWFSPLFCYVQWKVLQTGDPYTHVGKTLARLGPRLPASHGDPHLHALCSQWQEGPLRLSVEGRQRLSECSSQRVSGSLISVPVLLFCGKSMSNALHKTDYRFAKYSSSAAVCVWVCHCKDSYCSLIRQGVTKFSFTCWNQYTPSIVLMLT